LSVIARTQPAEGFSAAMGASAQAGDGQPQGSFIQNQEQASSNPDSLTEEELTFTGRIWREKSEVVLWDPVTKMIYQLDDQAKARQFLGKEVKIVGKLGMGSNTVYVNAIHPVASRTAEPTEQ
jgi:hypothetical protein